MWKNILATAALVLSVGVTYHLIQSANADFGPQISIGQNPIVNYGGTINQNTPVFTAPSDQDVILTTIMTNDMCQIAIDGTVILPLSGYFSPTFLYNRLSYTTSGSDNAFLTGNAKLKVPAGSTLTFVSCSPHYYMEGYLSHP